MVVDKEPALDVIQGKVAVVGPDPLAEFVVPTLPDVLADQVHHRVVSLRKLGRPVAGNEVRLGLHQDTDRSVKIICVGGSGDLSRGGVDNIGNVH